MGKRRVPLQSQVSERLMGVIDARANACEMTRSKWVALALAEFADLDGSTPESREIEAWQEEAAEDSEYVASSERGVSVAEYNLSGRVTPSEAARMQADIENEALSCLFDVFGDESLRSEIESQVAMRFTDSIRRAMRGGDASRD